MLKKYSIPEITIEELAKADVLLASNLDLDQDNGSKNEEDLISFALNELSGG